MSFVSWAWRGEVCGPCSCQVVEKKPWHAAAACHPSTKSTCPTRVAERSCLQCSPFKLGLIFQVGLKEAHGLCRFKESGSNLLHEQPSADFIFHKSTTKGKLIVLLSPTFPPTLSVCQGSKSPADFPVPHCAAAPSTGSPGWAEGCHSQCLDTGCLKLTWVVDSMILQT